MIPLLLPSEACLLTATALLKMCSGRVKKRPCHPFRQNNSDSLPTTNTQDSKTCEAPQAHCAGCKDCAKRRWQVATIWPGSQGTSAGWPGSWKTEIAMAIGDPSRKLLGRGAHGLSRPGQKSLSCAMSWIHFFRCVYRFNAIENCIPARPQQAPHLILPA